MAFATRASLSLSRAAVPAPKAGSRRAAPVACAPVETVEAATSEASTSEAEAMPAPPAPETFGEIMNFSSYGPELFNGRIAQVRERAARRGWRARTEFPPLFVATKKSGRFF